MHDKRVINANRDWWGRPGSVYADRTLWNIETIWADIVGVGGVPLVTPLPEQQTVGFRRVSEAVGVLGRG